MSDQEQHAPRGEGVHGGGVDDDALLGDQLQVRQQYQVEPGGRRLPGGQVCGDHLDVNPAATAPSLVWSPATGERSTAVTRWPWPANHTAFRP